MEIASIIIPAYNAEAWLEEAVESALLQEYPFKEVIVIDDGSTDATPAILEKLSRYVVAKRQPQLGVCAARNHGVRLARGEIIQFLDSDDLLHKSRLSLMIDAWRSFPGTDLISASFICFQDRDVPSDFNRAIPGNCGIKIGLQDTLLTSYLPWAALFRKSFLSGVGPWNETLRRWEDLEYHVRISCKEPSAPHISAPLYGYRQHSAAPRISDGNRNHTLLDNARSALLISEKYLQDSQREKRQTDDYLFPFFLHLARQYGIRGNKQQFLELLQNAARLTPRSGFKAKAYAAMAMTHAFGVAFTSRVTEFILAASVRP